MASSGDIIDSNNVNSGNVDLVWHFIVVRSVWCICAKDWPMASDLLTVGANVDIQRTDGTMPTWVSLNQTDGTDNTYKLNLIITLNRHPCLPTSMISLILQNSNVP